MQLDSVAYDPDEALSGFSPGTPQMKAVHPKLELTESPPPEIPSAQVSFSPPPLDGFPKSNRPKIRPVSGDAVLVAYLGGGSHPEIAQAASHQALPGADEGSFELDDEEDDETPQKSPSRDTNPAKADIIQLQRPDGAATALRAVAADALAAGGHLSGEDKPSVDQILLSPRPGELPPLQIDSPKYDGVNGLSLPSIRTTLGATLDDINHHHPTDMPTPNDSRDIPGRHTGDARTFSRSPTVGVPRFSSMSTGSRASHPISPSESYQRSFPSPNSLPASSPDNFASNGSMHRSPGEYSSNSASGNTLQPGYTITSPVPIASVADRMSIDGITNPQVGSYSCTFPGCTAPPFQTQYLLNSHANVHSSVRPHYCPVQGCPRSEGGKGFKRKNEMIRHGLVHDSPGYVCPFCADREHKYPRPDNLQRHVRVHHIDKNKDDPLLRDVLAQRPDGPSRGRRRRAQA
ncbi:uncharacterized protein TRIVIDRAFT_83596 [Trichoderma virens Gv29-8]|uniref:C2H2-type domain-containing protein n=1 Tax=Hypocrea virens (strain Gv29-8 / FGSC 10586) TaxID=413071 RepID=G9MX93_HYPVG|nr:uncharacterized protein TRIVIDRAFT_83596 [Trichoderma virens Gv29-8]EHK21025.1 hypothetical protein TRIVIDRAFT_83596 [Trichoderma virens Gv29-8]